MKPTQYKPTSPMDFIGKTAKIAALLFKNAENRVDCDTYEQDIIKWLFYGPAGTGKTALAMACASKLAGNPSYVAHLNGQSMSVDVVRSWRDANQQGVLPPYCFVVVVDEVDMASHAAFSEVRTFLDEMKSHMCFIATTNKTPEELEPQFQSRLKVYRFEPIPIETICTFMHKSDLLAVPEDIALEAAGRSDGNVRQAMIDAESMMEAKELE